jgi:hypothetical protein
MLCFFNSALFFRDDVNVCGLHPEEKAYRPYYVYIRFRYFHILQLLHVQHSLPSFEPAVL